MGGEAICSSRLGAFFGFFHKDFSQHDYFLGRRNCREFLQKTFVLLDTNKVLALPETKRNNTLLPIIPLCGSAAEEQTLPKWPNWTGFSSEDVRPRIKARLKAVIDAQVDYFLKDQSVWVRAAGQLLLAINKLALVGPMVTAICAFIDDAKAGKTDDPNYLLPPL